MDMSCINSATAVAEAYREEQLKKQRENERDFAIQQTMANTYKQNILLQNQLNETKEQVNLLEKNNKILQGLYDNAIKDSERNKKAAKKSIIISIIAVVVSVISIITSVLISVLL